MGKKKRKKTDAEREWDRRIDERIQNLRELAGGRAEREWRAKQARAAG
jgi:hypothetical protein